MTKKIYDYKFINKARCISGIVVCSLMVFVSLLALVLNVAGVYGDKSSHGGIETFRMFTTISNLIVMGGAFLCIPFQIDGLRRKDYHLPRWIVDVLYIGTTGVAVTFVSAITLITFANGFVDAMFANSNIFLHTINPIIAILLFTVFNSDHHIKFRKTILAISPIIIYGIIYVIMVFIIGEENGGWDDHYMTNIVFPWPISLLIFSAISFGVCALLRVCHNKTHQLVKNGIKRYYLESEDYQFDTFEEAVEKLAKEQKEAQIGIDMVIPNRIINFLIERYQVDISEQEVLKLYIEKYVLD